MTSIPVPGGQAAQAPRGRIPPRLDEIFQALPALSSPEYLMQVNTASAADLPPEVLARAYRQLPAASPAAEATLARLLGYTGRAAIRAAARRMRRQSDDYFDLEDVEQATMVEILEVLGAQRGANAERYWNVFCYERAVDAIRILTGRKGKRRLPMAAALIDDESGDAVPPDERPDARKAAWHGSIEPNFEAWLQDFLDRTIAAIENQDIQRIAKDQWGSSGAQSPLSGKAGAGVTPLTVQLGYERTKIHRLRDVARTLIYWALRRQTERDVPDELLERLRR